MLRQTSSRNHRSKGFKIKNALQIFLLVAVSIWLLYQVKHSHEKKRAFEERNSQSSTKVAENEPDFLRFGRKDVPHIKPEETGSVNEIHDEEAENGEIQEEGHETVHEANVDEEGKDTGNDEIDEHDEEKADEEPDHEEESTEEEDKDNHDDEDMDGKDEVDFFESRDHEGGTQEAREENYRRDDASSAVVHESENGGEKSVDEDQTADKIEDGTTTNLNGSKNYEIAENVTNGTGSDSFIGSPSKDNETMISDNSSSNVTGTVIKDIEFPKPENGTDSNSTSNEHNSQIDSIKVAETNNQLELQSISTGAVSGNSMVVDGVAIPVSNDTVRWDSAQDQNSSGDNKSDTSEVESEVNSTNTSKNENVDGEQGESNSAHDDVIPEEVREARTDLSTLPDVQNEVKMTDDDTSE